MMDFSVAASRPDAATSLYVVGAGRRRAAFAGPVGVEKFAARFVHPFVGVRAKIITLRLQQVRRQNGAAILIVKREGGAEGGNRNAFFRGGGDDVAPAFLRAFDFATKIIVEQQVSELGIVVVGFLDLAEETRTDDAAAAPHQRDAPEIQ